MVEYDFTYENRRLRDLGFIMAKPENENNFGLTREIIKGATTSCRSITNHYGVRYSDVLTIPFFIIKDICKNTDLTIDRFELRTLQSWLTSSKIPKPLKVETFEHEIVEYSGIFSDVTPFECNNLCGLYFTFTCNSPYAFNLRCLKVECSNEETRNFMCDSDELNESLYPIVIIKPNSIGIFSIENINTKEIMTFSFEKKYDVISIDCANKRIIADGEIINLYDIGWDTTELLDYNNIGTGISKLYFLHLFSGNNPLKFTGNGTFYIKCKVPMKIGGF